MIWVDYLKLGKKGQKERSKLLKIQKIATMMESVLVIERFDHSSAAPVAKKCQFFL